jgi:hypothetical protein
MTVRLVEGRIHTGQGFEGEDENDVQNDTKTAPSSSAFMRGLHLHSLRIPCPSHLLDSISSATRLASTYRMDGPLDPG